jgi:hypothetical protein
MAALLVSDRNVTVLLAQGVAVAGWCALALQSHLFIESQVQQGYTLSFGVLMCTGYFTILTNALCALVATAWREPWVVTAAAASIILAGVIFFVLLREQYEPTGLAVLTNTVHHYIVPALFTLLWWRVVPRGSLVWSDVWRVFAWPAAYMVYIVARGEITGLYPYFFIDVATLGYSQAFLNAAGLSAVFIGTGTAYVALKR